MSVVLQAVAIMIFFSSAAAQEAIEVLFEDPATKVLWESENIARVILLRRGPVDSTRTTVTWSCKEDGNYEGTGFDGHVIFDLYETRKIIEVPIVRNAGQASGDRDLNLTINTVPATPGGVATKTLHVVDDACGYYLRIGVFLDSSQSLTQHNFFLMKNFVQSLSKRFPMAIDRTAIALAQFSTFAFVRLGFEDAESHERPYFEHVLGGMELMAGTTRVDRALASAKELFERANNESMGIDSQEYQATKILLVITDGRAPYDIDPYTPIQHELQHRLQVEIMAVGTRHPQIESDPDDFELKAISAGKQGNIFYMDNLADLVDKIKLEGRSYCQ